MTPIKQDPRLCAAIGRYMRGEAPLIMSEVAHLPLYLPDGRTIAFGDATPDDLLAQSAAVREQARRDYAATLSEWGGDA